MKLKELHGMRAGKRSGRKPAKRRSRADLKRAIVAAFRAEFPTDTVDVSDGYKDNLHVMVVSRKFDTMTPRQQQDMMWTLLRSASLNTAERALVTVLLPLSPAEIK